MNNLNAQADLIARLIDAALAESAETLAPLDPQETPEWAPIQSELDSVSWTLTH